MPVELVKFMSLWAVLLFGASVAIVVLVRIFSWFMLWSFGKLIGRDRYGNPPEIRACLAGALVAILSHSIFESFLVHALPELWQWTGYIIGWFMGGVFAGFLTAALVSRRKLKTALAVVWPTILLLLTGWSIRTAVNFAVGKTELEFEHLKSDLLYPTVAAAISCLFYGIGGFTNERFGKWIQSNTTRKQANYKTDQGVSFTVTGPWQYPTIAMSWRILAYILGAIGLVGLFGFFIPALVLFSGLDLEKLPDSSRYLFDVAESLQPYSFNSIVIGCIAITIARKRNPKFAIDTINESETKPILFLRSFGDDAKKLFDGISSQVFSPLASVLGKSTEQRLVKLIGKSGPVVAIGRPNEDLAEFGASRVYVGDANWKDLVTDLMVNSQFVVLQAGATEGLKWELGKILENVSPDKAMIFLPYEHHYLPFSLRWLDRNASRKCQFFSFKQWADKVLPKSLPDTPKSSFAIQFLEDWQPDLIVPKMAFGDRKVATPVRSIAKSFFLWLQKFSGLFRFLQWYLFAFLISVIALPVTYILLAKLVSLMEGKPDSEEFFLGQ